MTIVTYAIPEKATKNLICHHEFFTCTVRAHPAKCDSLSADVGHWMIDETESKIGFYFLVSDTFCVHSTFNNQFVCTFEEILENPHDFLLARGDSPLENYKQFCLLSQQIELIWLHCLRSGKPFISSIFSSIHLAIYVSLPFSLSLFRCFALLLPIWKPPRFVSLAFRCILILTWYSLWEMCPLAERLSHLECALLTVYC